MIKDAERYAANVPAWSPVSHLHFTQQTDHTKRAGHEVDGGAVPCNVTHGHEADSIESVSELSSKTCRVRGVTYTNMMKLRAKSKRLTDAFTKMLMPGTSTREISACASVRCARLPSRRRPRLAVVEAYEPAEGGPGRLAQHGRRVQDVR